MVDSANNIAPLLNPREVAALLKMSTTAIYALCDAGEITCHRVGLGKKRKRIRITTEAVNEYLQRTEQEAAAVIPIAQAKRGSASQGLGFSRLRAAGWKG